MYFLLFKKSLEIPAFLKMLSSRVQYKIPTFFVVVQTGRYLYLEVSSPVLNWGYFHKEVSVIFGVSVYTVR